MLCGRRAFVVETIALAAFPAIAATSPPKTANIHWAGPGHELHGYMAIPGKAHGAQPAVLVVHDAGGADAFLRGFADRLADAGFVACAPSRLASLEEGAATVRWLATNRYSTGKVAAVGLGWGGALVDRLAASPQLLLAAAVTFGASEETAVPAATPLLQLDAIGQMSADAYAQAWLRTIAFLKEHLA
jgi:dienelactone hydrolase